MPEVGIEHRASHLKSFVLPLPRVGTIGARAGVYCLLLPSKISLSPNDLPPQQKQVPVEVSAQPQAELLHGVPRSQGLPQALLLSF